MASVQNSHQLTMRYIALVLVCLIFHILLTDCGPIRKRKGRSKNASAVVIHGTGQPTLNQTSTIIANINADHLQDAKTNKNVVQFDQVNFAGKQVAPGHVNDPVNEDVAAGNGPVPGVQAPHQSVGDGEQVGQLPAVLAIPDSSKVNTTLQGQKPKLLETGNGKVEQQREEQGVAVGVGGMNREASTTATQAPQVGGPDSSLDVGAADRGDAPESRPKAQSQNEASDDNPSDTGKTREGDDSRMNPALQQPPPQAREPPDQFQNKKIQLGPVRPDRDAPVLVPPGQQPAPLGRDEVQLEGTKDPPTVPNDIDDEEQSKEHPLKFNQQKKNVAANTKQSEKLDDINPPDHMEGFRLERDGHLNRDYKKEIFLGHHEEFEWSDEEKVSGKLKVIFRR